MKKFVAILLCVAMLMVGVVAQAENGYVTMKALFGDKDQLGTGTSRTIDSLSDKKLVIIFDFIALLTKAVTPLQQVYNRHRR